MEKKKILIVVLLVMVNLLFASSSFSQTPIIWRGQNAYPTSPNMGPFPKDTAGVGNAPLVFGNWLSRETKGQFQLQLAQPGAIVPVGQMFQAISKGALDFGGLYWGGFHTGIMPEADVEIGLPFAWETLAEAWDAFQNRGLLKEFQKIYAEHNLYWIPTINNVTFQVGTTFPVPNPAALKGKKIRAGGVIAELYKRLGATPVLLPAGELYMALKLGTIDGSQIALDFLESSKLKEVWKNYVVSPNYSVIVGNFVINMDTFNRLPKDIKSLIENHVHHVLLENSLNNAVWEKYLATKAIKENPSFKLVEWSDKDAAAVRKIGISTWDTVAAKSPRCARLVDIVKEQMRDLGKI
jgi:TRAP-type C4-dicarboxylate transport system substrate-binding protein